MVEVRAQLRHLRMSPKKVRLVANTIKGLPVHEALTRLQFVHRAPATPIAKLLKSAIANAVHNNNLSANDLTVKRIVVNEAPALKRWKPAAFGAAHPFKRRGSHIDLTLGLKAGAKAETPVKPTVKKTATGIPAATAQAKYADVKAPTRHPEPKEEAGSRITPTTALLARKKPRKNPRDAG